MRFYLLSVRILALSFLILLANCSGKNVDIPAVENSETEASTPPPPTTAAAASTAKCEDGQAPKIISGECSGVWSVKKNNDQVNCEFEWKPTVTCPKGMKAMGLQAACYGVTIRPAQDDTKTSAECLAAHGKHPISPAYKLECCP